VAIATDKTPLGFALSYVLSVLFAYIIYFVVLVERYLITLGQKHCFMAIVNRPFVLNQQMDQQIQLAGSV
jgi:hypothetical protein